MLRPVVIAFALLAGGCDVLFLDPHGVASLCAATHSTMQPAVDAAVAYWVDARLPNLHSCSSGSVEVEVVPAIPGKVGDTYEDNAGTIHVRVDDGVLMAAADDRLWVRVYAATVLAHELGHALGLPHATDSGSVMWPQSQALPAPVNATDAAWVSELLQGMRPVGQGRLDEDK